MPMQVVDVLDEIKPALLQVCEILRVQQETLFQLHVSQLATLASLKEHNRVFATRYASNFMALEGSVLHHNHMKIARALADTVQLLKNLER